MVRSQSLTHVAMALGLQQAVPPLKGLRQGRPPPPLSSCKGACSESWRHGKMPTTAGRACWRWPLASQHRIWRARAMGGVRNGTDLDWRTHATTFMTVCRPAPACPPMRRPYGKIDGTYNSAVGEIRRNTQKCILGNGLLTFDNAANAFRAAAFVRLGGSYAHT